MPNRRPTPADAAAVRDLVLRKLASDADIGEVLRELEPLHPRNNTFPAEGLIGLTADVLDVAEVGADRHLDLEGARDKVLDDYRFRGREQQRLNTVLLIAPALRAGVDTDLLDLTYWWARTISTCTPSLRS